MSRRNSAGPRPCAIVWMRRAFRVDDNAPLWHAVQEAAKIIPLLVVNDDPRYAADTNRRRFVRGAIADLDAGLRMHGSHVHVRVGPAPRELARAAAAYGADTVYAARVYHPSGIARDAAVARELARTGRRLILVNDLVLREPSEVRTQQDQPFRMFTPFQRRWQELADDVPRPLPGVQTLLRVPCAEGSTTVDRIPYFAGTREGLGEPAAALQLRRFLQKDIAHYHLRRDYPAAEGTSHLSQHLALGTLSPRQVYWSAYTRVQRDEAGMRTGPGVFIMELLWREFYHQILASFPHAQDHAFRKEFRDIRWHRSPRAFARWKDGRTGYPIVDAAMRQLNTEGWMHNRARMIVASFLTKDLLLHWRWGERYFMDHLVDADIASNNGGWQWAAGTGTDASPWFRIFNPVVQGKTYDPDGAYVRRYLPELRHVPDRFVHEPWRMTRAEQKAAGCILDREYPQRIVDHAKARAAALLFYSSSRRHAHATKSNHFAAAPEGQGSYR